jgi:hypothetical protein
MLNLIRNLYALYMLLTRPSATTLARAARQAHRNRRERDE